MPITVVQHQPLVENAATTHTVTLGSAPTERNLTVVVFKPGTIGANVTPPAGWIQAVTQDRGGSIMSTGIYYRVAAAGDPAAISFTTTSVAAQMEAFEVSGLATVSPLDKTNSIDGGTSTGTSTGPAFASGALSQAAEWVVAAAGLNSTSAGETVDSGFGLRDDATLTSLIVADLITTTTGSLAPSFGWTTLRTWVGVIATFKAAPLPPQPTIKSRAVPRSTVF